MHGMAFLIKENRSCGVEMQLFDSKARWKHNAVPTNTHRHREEEEVTLLEHNFFVAFIHKRHVPMHVRISETHKDRIYTCVDVVNLLSPQVLPVLVINGTSERMTILFILKPHIAPTQIRYIKT